MLPQSEWLPQAQKLSVGMRIRVRHKYERRANMTIGNERGHWWAYCQACKQGGRLDKEHVLLGDGAPEASERPQSLAVPSDMVAAVRSDYERLVGLFLASKGMMFPYLPKLWVSQSQGRVLFQDDARAWHGRDLTGRSNAKWLHYGAKFSGDVGYTSIVTEDLFSLYKVRFALRDMPDLHVVSTLGAGVSDYAALALKSARRIVWMYDGDKAGDEGFTYGSKRMRPFNPKQYRARPPEGLDPKDMDCQDIRALIQEVLK